MSQEQSFDMSPVEVPQEILNGLKIIPTATVYNAVRHFGVLVNVCEGLARFTPGSRFAARARTLRFLPIRPDLLAEVGKGEEAPEYRAMGRCGPGDVLVADLMDREVLNDEAWEKMQEEIAQEIKAAVKFAEESPFPEPEDALEDVFAE